jgi:FAD-dependent urate hydroxylase
MKGLIVGGGITGLTMCHALIKSGIKPVLFEKRVNAISNGTGLTLWNSAIKGLEHINPHVAKSIKDIYMPISKRLWANSNGKTLNVATLDADDCICLPYSGLINVLKAELPRDTILSHHEVVSFQENPDSITLRFQNGKSDQGDFLIACDGKLSTIRPSETQAIPLHVSTYRGITNRSVPNFESGTLIEYLGKNLRIQLTSMKDGKVYWCAYGTEKPDFTPSSIKEYILKEFEQFPTVVRDVLEASNDCDAVKDDIIVLDPSYSRSFASPRMCIAGDAKNLISPELGMGGCLGIEDAHLMSIILEQGFNPKTFQRWEELRFDRVRNLQKITMSLSTLMNATSSYRAITRDWTIRWASSKLMKGHIQDQTHWTPTLKK